jgi:hypothetical protein
MVEGSHTDSSKKHHIFDADRICRIVDNTNNWIARGGRVPWQLDHKKTQDANIGDLESGLEARVITPEDLPNPKLRHLVGKIGAFAERLVGKGVDVVNMVTAGRVKTLSPGIDVREDIIKEISATPTPAIVGLSTFKRHQGNFALTMDEAEMEGEEEDIVRQQFHEKGELFLEVVNSILSAGEDELQGQDPQALLMQAIQDYMSRVSEVIGIGEQQPEVGYAPQTPMYQGAPMPGYLQAQQGLPANAGAMAPMSSNEVLAAFTMRDMQKIIDHERAEFVFGGYNVRSPFYQQPPAQPQKKRNLLSTAAKLGGLALGGAAAIRYGGVGLKGAARGAKSALRQKNPLNITRVGVAKGAIGGGYKAAGRQIRRDIAVTGRGVRRVGAAISSGAGAGYKALTTRLPKPPKPPTY